LCFLLAPFCQPTCKNIIVVALPLAFPWVFTTFSWSFWAPSPRTGYNQVGVCVDAFVDRGAFEKLPELPPSPFLAEGEIAAGKLNPFCWRFSIYFCYYLIIFTDVCDCMKIHLHTKLHTSICQIIYIYINLYLCTYIYLHMYICCILLQRAVIECNVLLCCVVLCHVMFCYVMLCCVHYMCFMPCKVRKARQGKVGL
jgi:hypothetical protein